MVKNILKLFLLTLLCLNITINQAYTQPKKDLTEFIKQNNWKQVQENAAKDEEFQILVSFAKEQELDKLKDIIDSPSASESEKILAIKALGLKEDKDSSALLTHVLLHNTSKDIVYAAAWSLLQIGGERNYYFITDNFKRIQKLSNKEDLTYPLLIKLCYNYKTKTVLKLIEEYLYVIPINIFKPVFLFTVFGKSLESEQMLDKKLSSPDKNVRLNSSQIFGRWYASPNAVFPFELLIKTEKDPDIRNAVITGLERIGTQEARNLLKKIIQTSQSKEEKAHAQSSLNKINSTILEVKKDFKHPHKPQFSTFKEELDKLMNSKGYYGSYELLEKNAQLKDIPRLETLRETIMLNMSENATMNYDKVTDIIRKLRIKNELK
jgi:hypothetical protein